MLTINKCLRPLLLLHINYPKLTHWEIQKLNSLSIQNNIILSSTSMYSNPYIAYGHGASANASASVIGSPVQIPELSPRYQRSVQDTTF